LRFLKSAQFLIFKIRLTLVFFFFNYSFYRFQEIVPLRASFVLGSENSKISVKWNSLIREALNKKIQHCLEKQQYNNKLGRKQKTAEDDKAIFESSIPEGFRCVISKQMVGILISVWIRSDLRPYVRHPRASCVGCGIMGYLGNKVLFVYLSYIFYSD